jgi:hypothetical protein
MIQDNSKEKSKKSKFWTSCFISKMVLLFLENEKKVFLLVAQKFVFCFWFLEKEIFFFFFLGLSFERIN